MAASKTFEQKILYTGTQAEFATATKDPTRLYFTSDTHKLYKGDVDFSEAVRTVASLPSSGAANGVLYVVVTSGVVTSAAVTANGGTSWTTIVLGASTYIDPDAGTGDNVTYPTTKAMVDYVTAKVGDSGAVTSISATTVAANIKYAQAGVSEDTVVEVPGVVYNPVWNSTTRTLTMQVTAVGTTAAKTVTVDIGKDLVLESGRYDATTEKIILVLNDDAQTEIEIPVDDLIQEIAVADTNSVDLTMTIDTAGAGNHVITADVKVGTKTGVTNYLAIQAAGEGQTAGLFVDLTTIETAIATAEDNINALYASLGTWHAIASA